MSEEKKPTRRITAYYATDEDYKRMNFFTVGTFYRAETIAARRETQPVIEKTDDSKKSN